MSKTPDPAQLPEAKLERALEGASGGAADFGSPEAAAQNPNRQSQASQLIAGHYSPPFYFSTLHPSTSGGIVLHLGALIMAEEIVIRGSLTPNLKNINLTIPRDRLVVFTGLSGSGKSSLAFDTIFAEGQRRYVESLSSYARPFLNQMQKPEVDEIEGLSPAISIDQKTRSNNPRSTVATITEIYDYLRVLYARVGKPECLTCGREIRKLSTEEILESVMSIVEQARKSNVRH